MERPGTQSKAALLAARREKYEQTRYVQQMTSDAIQAANVTSSPSHNGLNRTENSRPTHSQDTESSRSSVSLGTSVDEILNDLTARMADKIRSEVIRQERDNSLRDDRLKTELLSRIDDFVGKELSSFTCQICYELMRPPDHLPTLLFPCGHTFCAECITNHLRDKRAEKRTCPYCRTVIQSQATNQPLKELVEQFATQKQKIETGRASTNDLFVSKKSDYTMSSSNEIDSNRTNFLSQLRSCKMRYSILSNELQDIAAEKETVSKRRSKIEFAQQHLTEEKTKLEQKIQLLQEEHALINEHLQQQSHKLEEILNKEASATNKERLLTNTLHGLEREIEKLNILANSS